MRNRPTRIQRTRQHPYMNPNNLEIVYVGRPSQFGNSYELSDMPRKVALEAYKQWLMTHFNLDYVKEALKGKNLSCWCPLNKECHGDILLKIANS